MKDKHDNTLLKQDQECIWHPFTQHSEKTAPLLIKKAKGLMLYDKDNKKYFDTISSWWCNILGHSHPSIVKAIQKQVETLDHIIFAGFTHEAASTLAPLLLEKCPNNLSKVFFSDNGSTSIEVALKQSLQYWHLKGLKTKQEFVCFEGGYHGDTIGCMSISGTRHFHQHFNSLCFHSECLPNPSNLYDSSQEEKSLEACKKLFQTKHNQIAALIIEPLLMAAGGMLTHSKGFLQNIYSLCKEYNIHFILDEVAVGFGRTGSYFACLEAEIQPDFLCLSKGLTNGNLPLAATVVAEEIYNAFLGPYESHTFFHGHTFSGNPIACAAAIATLKELQKEALFQHILLIQNSLFQKAKNLETQFPLKHSRFCGLIWAFDLEIPHHLNKRFSLVIYQLALNHGLILRPLGNTVYLNLPLITNEEELDQIFKSLRLVLQDWFSLG